MNIRRSAFTGFGAVLLFVFAFVAFFALSFRTVIVSGQSMLPTLKSGKKVLVSSAYWLVGPIKHKDIVVIQGEDPGEFIIKRVYRLGGEKVDTFNAPDKWSLANGQYTVPPGEIYLLGDNRAVSEDSRRFGAVPRSKVLGKVVAY